MTEGTSLKKRLEMLDELGKNGHLTDGEIKEQRDALISGKENVVEDLYDRYKLLEEKAITKEEFEKGKKDLLHPKKEAASAPVFKKRHGCGCFSIVCAGIIGIVALLSGLRSCDNGKSSNNQVGGASYVPSARQVTPPVVRESATKQAALASKEDWRADFNKKIAKYPQKDQRMLHAVMTYLSCFRERIIAAEKGDKSAASPFAEKMTLAKNKAREEGGRRGYELADEQGREWVKVAKELERRGLPFEMDMREAADKLVKAYEIKFAPLRNFNAINAANAAAGRN